MASLQSWICLLAWQTVYECFTMWFFSVFFVFFNQLWFSIHLVGHHGDKRSLQKVSRSQFGLLHSLCDGDMVKVDTPDGVESAEVLEVDQFRRILKVCMGETIREIGVELIDIKEGN